MPVDKVSDPLFWPLLIVAAMVLAVAVVFAWIIHMIVTRQGMGLHEAPPGTFRPSLLELGVLLQDLFAVDELRRFLHLHLGAEGQALVQSLPSGRLSHDELVYEILVALQQRGILEESFFDALVLARPRREFEIRRVQRTDQRHRNGRSA